MAVGLTLVGLRRFLSTDSGIAEHLIGDSSAILSSQGSSAPSIFYIGDAPFLVEDLYSTEERLKR